MQEMREDFRKGVVGKNDLLNIELRSDSLKMFDQAWEETLMAMEIGLDRAFLESLCQNALPLYD